MSTGHAVSVRRGEPNPCVLLVLEVLGRGCVNTVDSDAVTGVEQCQWSRTERPEEAHREAAEQRPLAPDVERLVLRTTCGSSSDVLAAQTHKLHKTALSNKDRVTIEHMVMSVHARRRLG